MNSEKDSRAKPPTESVAVPNATAATAAKLEENGYKRRKGTRFDTPHTEGRDVAGLVTRNYETNKEDAYGGGEELQKNSRYEVEQQYDDNWKYGAARNTYGEENRNSYGLVTF